MKKKKVASSLPPKRSQVSQKPQQGESRLIYLIDWEYDKSQKLMLWKINDVTDISNPKELTLAYVVDDLMSQFVKNPSDLPLAHVFKFCDDVKKRKDPFKIIAHATGTLPKNKDDITDEFLDKANSDINNYPFYEVGKHLGLTAIDEVQKKPGLWKKLPKHVQ